MSKKTLLNEFDGDHNNDKDFDAFNINQNYAKKFEYNKRR